MAGTRVIANGVCIDEYLAHACRPGVEYIDGERRERPRVVYGHGRVQVLIGLWFGLHEPFAPRSFRRKP